MNKLGKQTVTVSYRGFTGTYEIEVLDPKAVAEITAAKTKTTYEVGDTLKTDDIKVTAVCADKTTKEVTDFTLDTSKVNMKKAGKYTITVSGEGRTTITITANPHIVKFDANGGTVSKDILKISTHNATIGSLPTPTRSGYVFQGWYTAKTGGTKITTATKVTQSMTVYAQWKAKATTTTTTVTAPGKTYYVKVRAYVKNPSNKKVYGAYSAAKTIKIKKQFDSP